MRGFLRNANAWFLALALLASGGMAQDVRPAPPGAVPRPNRAKPEIPPPPGLAALAAGEWQACLEQIAERYAVPRELTAYEKRDGVPNTPLAQLGVESVLVAAASAQALGPEAVKEWGTKLYGEDPIALEVFGIFVEQLNGNYDRLFPLFRVVYPIEKATKRTSHWVEAAAALDQAASGKPERSHWQYTAGALRIMALWRCRLHNEAELLAVTEPFAALPDEFKGKLVDLVLAYREPGPSQIHIRYQTCLQKPITDGVVKDPQLARLLIGVIHDPRARSGIASQIAGKSPAAANAMVDETVKLNSDNPEVICQSARTMSRVGRRDEAVALLRDAEKRLGYPGRQQIRRSLFGLMRGQTTPPMPPRPGLPPTRPGGPPQSIAQFPELARELEARLAVSDVPPVEMALIKADLYGTASLPREMTAAYAEAYELATDPVVRQLAWEGWAAGDPQAAWAQLDTVDQEFFAGTVLNGAARGELACKVLRVGLIAKDEAGACAWAQKRSSVLAGSPAGARVAAFPVLLHVLDTGDGPAALIAAIEPELKALPDAGRSWLIQSLVADPRQGITLGSGGGSDRELTAVLGARFQRADRWDLALAVATAAMPLYQQKKDTAYPWRQILLACPADETQAAARQAGLAALTERCVADLPAEPKRTRSLAARDYLDTAAGLVSGPQGKRLLPYCQTVLARILGQAPAVGLDNGNSLVPILRTYGRGLAKCGGDVAAYCELVRQIYPQDSEVTRILKELETGTGK